jgi:hypothetical protein
MKPAIVPSEEPVLNTEIKCLPLPNEILVKIFGYLDIQDISRCAQVSCQFNKISKDSSLWRSWGKVHIESMKVPTEFLAFIIQRGITELSLFQCEILPPRVKWRQPLNLKTLNLDETCGDKTLVNELLVSHPMEKVRFKDSKSLCGCVFDISQFNKCLPKIGSHLKCLNFENGGLGKYGDLGNVALIVNTCLDLEELNISCNSLSEEAGAYLCENLTANILKLDVEIGEEEPTERGLNDNNIRALVNRCPKLKVLDIRTNEKVTYQGVVAIIERLHFIEYLGLPDSIGDELGLPDNIDLSKMRMLKSMKKLKELLLGNEGDEYHSIFKREIPHLRKHEGPNFFEVALSSLSVTITKDFRFVDFFPHCHKYDKSTYTDPNV